MPNEYDPEQELVDSLEEGWSRPETTAPERPYREAFAGTDAEFDAMLANGVVPEDEPPVALPDEMDALPYAELQSRLKAEGLSASGTKDELVERLRERNQAGLQPQD